MKKEHQTVLSAGQMKELICAVNEGIPSNLSFEQAQYWIGHKKELSSGIKNLLFNTNLYEVLIVDWKKFYKFIGIKPDFTGLVIPPKSEGLDRLLIIAKGMTPQKAYDLCQRKFECWKWTDRNLDDIVHEDRSAKDKAYAVWIRDRVEADEELKDKSADKLKELGIKGITLTERLLYELKYFKETSEHLDIQNITPCTGSHCSDGCVPGVDWYGSYGEMSVSRFHSGVARGFLRSRFVVSF